jgi:archaellum biogenesis protein FlaJ (TadC family)
LTGILYGISVAITFPLYITVNVVDRIVHLFAKVSVPTGYETAMPLKGMSYDVPLLTTLIFIIVIVHAFFSAIMARVVSGGNKLGAMTHFVIMVWIAAIVAVGVEYGLKLMMG